MVNGIDLGIFFMEVSLTIRHFLNADVKFRPIRRPGPMESVGNELRWIQYVP